MPDDETRGENAASIPLAEERVTIGARRVVTGRHRVTTRTETLTEDVDARLVSNDFTVDRVPVGRDLEPGDAVPVPRDEGDLTIVPVLEEVLVVEKRLRLVEEIHIRRIGHVEDVTIPVTRRRQVAEIETDLPADPDQSDPNQQ